MVFPSTELSCLHTAVREVQNVEQTQEIRVPDGFPDIGRVLTSWGQMILRSKEWRTDHVLLTGGMMVWVLYAPEDGTQPRCLDAWIPFQCRWMLPEGTGEGTLRVCVQPRFVDARTVSPRKLMVRSGVSAYGEAHVPQTVRICGPEKDYPDVELLRSRFPVRLPKSAGEKSFAMEETLTASGTQPDSLVYYSLKPEVTEQKVLSNKIAFRGNANLHVLYFGEDGILTSQEFPMPFSQFAELGESFGSDAQSDVKLAVTNLEVELDAEKQIHLKCAMTAQYLLDDVELLEIVEDAYSPGKSLNVERQNLELPAFLEKKTQALMGETSAPGEGSQMVDVTMFLEYPRQFREEEGIVLEAPGAVQMLYYDAGGVLRSTASRWEGRLAIPAGEIRLTALPMNPGEPQISFGTDTITVRTEVPVQLTSVGGQPIGIVTELELEENQEPDAQRPSLILRRAGEKSLWELAKACGSTVDAIRRVNGLQDAPEPGRMLLIPVS